MRGFNRSLSDRIDKLEKRTDFIKMDCPQCRRNTIAVKTFEPNPNFQPYHPQIRCDIYTCTTCETRYTLETEKVFKKV